MSPADTRDEMNKQVAGVLAVGLRSFRHWPPDNA
jgi:hypothetical protein